MLEAEGLTLLELFLNHEEHDELYRLAEGLLEIDERMYLWRTRHFKVVERSIGAKVSGTQGTPVEVLGRLNSFLFFPELWEIRTTITNYAISQEGEN